MPMYSFDFEYRGISCRHTYVLPDDHPVTDADHLNINSPEIVARCRRMDELYFSIPEKKEKEHVDLGKDQLAGVELCNLTDTDIVNNINTYNIEDIIRLLDMRAMRYCFQKPDVKKDTSEQLKMFEKDTVLLLISKLIEEGHRDIFHSVKIDEQYLEDSDIAHSFSEYKKMVDIYIEVESKKKIEAAEELARTAYKGKPYDFSKHGLVDSGRVILDSDYVVPPMSPEQVAYWKEENERRMTTIHATIELQKKRVADFLDRKSRGDTWFDRI